jgi:hypothetical protein
MRMRYLCRIGVQGHCDPGKVRVSKGFPLGLTEIERIEQVDQSPPRNTPFWWDHC